MDRHEDTPQELAALELYQQLVNLTADTTNPDLIISIRLPDGRVIGDVDISRRDADDLADASCGIAAVRSYGDTEPLPDPNNTDLARETAAIEKWANEGHPDTSPVDETLTNTARHIEDAIPIDPDRMAKSTARFMGWLQGQSGEAIESGEWSAAAVAQNDPDLYADVTDLFAELDPIEITDKVIRDRQADLPDVAQLLDELFGDIPYPYADEDVPLPHDQAQMDALTTEIENYLEGGDA